MIIVLLFGCAEKQIPKKTFNSIILFKTKNLKFYDSGFIQYYNNFTQIEVFNASIPVISLKLYHDRICQSTFKCIKNKEFNKRFLNGSYPDNFLKDFFDGKNIKKLYHIPNTVYIKKSHRILFKDTLNNIVLMYKIND